MPTFAQIQAFQQKARAKGYSEAQIASEIARKSQEEARLKTKPVVTAPPAVPKTPPQPPAQKQPRTIKGLVQNAGQDALDFVVNAPIQAAKNIAGAAFEGARALDINKNVKESNKKIAELRKINTQLKKEKDPKKLQVLIEKSRAISDSLSQNTQSLRGATEAKNPLVNVEEVPTLKEFGVGILKNVGRTFGLKQGEDGKIVFDLEEAIQSAYEKPVTTALLAKDLGGGVNKLLKGKTGTKTLAKEAAEATPGRIEKIGSKLRKDVLNPQADASPFYAEEIAAMQKVQKKIGLEGSAQVQLEQLPKAFRKAQTEIKTLLNESKPAQRGTLTENFKTAVKDSNYGIEDVQFAKAIKTEAKILKSLEGKSPTQMYEQLSKYRALLKSTRKKLDSGTTLLPKEEARLAAFNAIKNTIDTVSPEVRALNTLENQMFNISEGLVKSSKKEGIGVGQLRVPNEVVQGIQDQAGKRLESAAGLPGKIKAGAKATIDKIPKVPGGTGVGMAASRVLSENGLVNPSATGNEENTDITQGDQGGGQEDNNQQDLEQNTLLNEDSIPQKGIFGDMTKQQVLEAAFKAGATTRQLDEIEKIYDRMAPQGTGILDESAQKAASDLRKEYISQTKENGYIEVTNAYRKVISSPDTAAGDVSLIFAYMKMLDPGSVVREGEFATAEQTAGIPDRIRNAYNKALKGKRLGSTQKKEFQEAAKAVYTDFKATQAQIDELYSGFATQYGIDPSLLGIGAIGVEE